MGCDIVDVLIYIIFNKFHNDFSIRKIYVHDD